MAINKFQRSKLIFDLSAKVAPISETTRPIELKFHMETSYDRLVKIYANYFGHMTKMSTTLI